MRNASETRLTCRAALAALLSLAALGWASATPAAGAGGPEFLVQFGETGVGAGQLNNPRGIATNPQTGHVFVVESANRRVSEFTPWGRFVKAFGWDVAAGAVNEEQEIRVRAAQGQFKLGFGASTTSDLEHDASAEEVESQLNALSTIGGAGGSVEVSEASGGAGGDTPTVYVVTFKDALAATNVAQITAADGTTALAGGSPSTTLEARTRANGVDAVHTGLEACTAESGCQAGTNSSGVGQLNNPLGVAVDSHGDLYVVDFGNRRVQKFNAAGEFLLMFGGNVDKGGGIPANPGNLCTVEYVANGDNCTGVASSSPGTGNGEFGAWKVGAFIAVDSSDHVYVGDNNRIQKFSSGGVWEESIALSSPSCGFVLNLALDPFGSRYVACESIAGVQRLGFGSPYPLDAAGTPKALASDAAGNLYVSDTSSTPDEIVKFNSSGEEKLHFGAPEDSTVALGNGLGTGVECPAPAAPTSGDVYASYFKSGSANYVDAFGPPPTCFESPPVVQPAIGAEYAASVGTTGAVVKAEVNPHFFPTTYYVEYGTADCESISCAEQPDPPGAALVGERNKLYSTGDVSLSHLTPGATYHYRFVAVSDAGTVFGPDRTFKTYLPGAFALPDGRAFELVSPPDKRNAEVGIPGNSSGLVINGQSVKPLQASVGGEAIAYPSLTAFGNAQGSPGATTYLSSRSATGWSTANITSPDQEGRTFDPFRGFSADLSFSAVIQKEPVLAPDAIEGFENLYLRDNTNGDIRALTTETPRGPEAIPSAYCVSFAGASADFDRVIFVANAALTTNAPEAAGVSLYEWSAADGIRLVSVLPGEAPAQPSESTGFGAVSTGSKCRMNFNILHNAISADGSRIFWTYAPPSGNTQLLARLDGTDTIQLDAPQGGLGPGGDGKFWAASDDGSKVFFTDQNELVPGASASVSGESLGDLYEYDFDAEPGEELTDLTVDPTPGSDPPAVQGVLGASEDGSYVYFVANGNLTGEEENANHQKAKGGQPNLYVWHAGEGLQFIATLSATDAQIGNNNELPRFSGELRVESSWSSVPAQQVARVTPDGRHLAFMSVASLTDFDNIGQNGGEPASQVYLYSADSKELTCASCNPSGARPIGFSELPVWITPYEQPRYLSDDGGRLFFLSFDALALNDTNGTQDVYEWEAPGEGSCVTGGPAYNEQNGGCLYLISSGHSSDLSYFLDASGDGRDAFLSSRQQLFPADEDERFDVYDARVGGGFPPPEPPPPICDSEACRPAQTVPSTASPASSAFAGEGNVRAVGGPNCLASARRAQDLDARAKRLRRRATRAGDPEEARRMRREASHLAKRAHEQSIRAKRCRSANQGAGK